MHLRPGLKSLTELLVQNDNGMFGEEHGCDFGSKTGTTRSAP